MSYIGHGINDTELLNRVSFSHELFNFVTKELTNYFSL